MAHSFPVGHGNFRYFFPVSMDIVVEGGWFLLDQLLCFLIEVLPGCLLMTLLDLT
jgi:hypothetical protein